MTRRPHRTTLFALFALALTLCVSPNALAFTGLSGGWTLFGYPDTIPQEGIFVLDAVYIPHDGEAPVYTITVTDADGAEVPGEASFDGTAALMWRATSGQLDAGASLTAQVDLIAPDGPSSYGPDERPVNTMDLVRDIPLEVSAEATPAVEITAEFVTHNTSPMSSTQRSYETGYTCALPVAEVALSQPVVEPGWMRPLFVYEVLVPSAEGGDRMTYGAGWSDGWIFHSKATAWVRYDTDELGNSYCVRVKTTNLATGAETLAESCLDAEAFDLDASDQEVCTPANIAAHDRTTSTAWLVERDCIATCEDLYDGWTESARLQACWSSCQDETPSLAWSIDPICVDSCEANYQAEMTAIGGLDHADWLDASSVADAWEAATDAADERYDRCVATCDAPDTGGCGGGPTSTTPWWLVAFVALFFLARRQRAANATI
jgi:hypothetical protein